MIGLDTNVLVRYVTQDDSRQAKAANQVIEDGLSAENPGFVSAIALVELTWVLESGYDCGREQVASVVDRLLRARLLVIENAEAVNGALRRYLAGSADFADCMIERFGRAAGCERTLTFDRVAARDAGMQLIEAPR